MGAVLVRQALPQDLDSLLTLYGELAGARAIAAPGDASNSRSLLAQILADPARHLAVAELDGQPAGTADLLVVANLTHHGRPWAIVENVIVAESARRRGVGRALFEHLIDHARSAGCFKIQLLSGNQRTAAHAFYEEIGLRPLAEGFRLYFDEEP
jgi:GNAT superfamily N-acetyltransferase